MSENSENIRQRKTQKILTIKKVSDNSIVESQQQLVNKLWQCSFLAEGPFWKEVCWR